MSLLCIGHRGAMGHAPENTLKSVSKALELGAHCVEVDVQNVDGRLIVFHDERLESTSSGEGYIREKSFEYLRALDAGGGEQIPTLEEVLSLINGRAGLNIELKGAGVAEPVVMLLSRLFSEGLNRNLVLVSSFNHRELQEVRRLDENIKLGALICGLPVDDAKFAESLGAYSVHPAASCVDRRFVEDAHKRGLGVFVYTVDHPEDISRIAQLGVDGVFSNYPERVLEYAGENAVAKGWF